MNKIKKILKHLKKPLLVGILIILLLSSFVADFKPAQAATYTWTQASWAGGTSGTAATHDANRDGLTPWTYYSSASTTISAGANLTLSATASSTTQTTDADFTAGSPYPSHSQTQVSSNSVILAQLSPWLTDWTYRKTVTVTNTSGSPISNYQTLVEIDTQILINAGKLQSDCNDIRFTDNDGTTLLTYWIEGGCNTTTTQIWVTVTDTISAGGQVDIYFYYGNASASAGTQSWSGQFILMNNAACPSGWTQFSALDSKFPRGSATYSGTGGASTHAHTFGTTSGGPSSTYNSCNYSPYGGNGGGSPTHTHSSSGNAPSANHTPPYLNVVFCSNSNLVVPVNFIALFSTSVPSGWVQFSSLDNKFPSGASTYGGTGGTATHTHTYSGTTGQSAAGGCPFGDYSTLIASDYHTHFFSSGSTPSADHTPPYLDVIFGQKSSQGPASSGLIAIANSNPPQGWTRVSALDNRFPRGAATYGGTGGNSTHAHSFSKTTGGPSSTVKTANGDCSAGTNVHTHTFNITTSSANHTPPYLDVLFVQKNNPITTVSLGSEGGFYYSSGTFTSGIININNVSWGNVSWTKTGTGTITMKARSCDDGACSAAGNVDESVTKVWTSCSNITSGNALSTGDCATNGDQYVQYQASLSTADTLVTPSLDDVTIGYNIYSSTNVLTSSKYDTSSDANIMGGIKWDEDATLPSGTTVTVSLRTASSEANLDTAAWTNFTNATADCSKTTGTVTCAATAIPAAMKDGIGDQWVQYKLTLTSTGANAATADNVILTYVVNARPEFDVPNTTASQISDSSDSNWGKVQIVYPIRDSDTDTGTVNPGYITPSFEYNIGGGWISITSGYLSSGALSNKAVETTNYTSYTAYWDAKSQIPTQYTSAGQIRITLNDNEGANNSTTTTISNITIDTTAPTLSTFTLDSSADTLTLASSDNSNIQYLISNNSDGSSDGANTTYNSWQTVGAVSTTTTIAWTYAPDSTGYESVTIAYRDIYGNTSTTTDVAPYMPNNFYYKDICNTAINDWREFLSWGQYTATTSAAFGSYKVYRSTDGSVYSLLVTNTPYTLNYHVDTTVASTTTYYYKAVTTDSDGDISSYTTPISDLPDGQGGSDSTAPIITAGPTVAETRSTWARITWTTDEVSNSIVEYGTTQSYGSIKTVDTMNTLHSVTITGLTPNTTYYYRVKSADIATNTVTSSGSSFTTTEGTVISDVTTESITDTTATIVWNTNTDSNSWVYYSTNSSFTSSSTSGTNTLVGTSTNNYFQHRVTLTSLTERTTYYYYVKSTDANSDSSTDTNAGNYYSFATTYDNQPPVISGILTPVRASNAIVIVWNTDENADTQVYYDTSSHTACSGYANSSTLDTNKTINHAVSLTSLSAETKYYYRVKSADANGNSTCSDEQNASTAAANEIITVYVGGGGVVSPTVTDTTPPSISNIKVSDIGAFNATVSFETSEASNGFVEYGKDTGYGNTAGSPTYQSSHQIKLSGLKLGTEYHFRVRAADKNGNIGESSDQTFTTKFAAEVLEDLVTLENAEQFQEQLEGLLESVMPSLVPPFVSNVKIDEINEDSALVFWKTNVPAHGSLFFAEDSKYEEGKYATEIAENKGKIKDHELRITDLMPSAKYHVQAKSYVFPDVVGKSKDYTFFTKSAKTKPEIINVGNTEFTVAWRTSKETSSFVQYTNTGTMQKGQTGTEEKTSQHVVKVENLIPDTLYEVRVYGYDADNNLVEADPLTVRTKKDVVPPKISSISINSAFVPYKADQLQTVISWKTDEPANSLVYFEEGVGVSTDLKNKAGQLDEYVLDHSVIITNFKPATIYRIKISSTDEARNTTVGPMRTILAPRSTESVFEIITKNLEEAFGFLKKIGQ